MEEQFFLVFPIAVVIGLGLARGRLSGPWTVVSIGTALSLGALLIAPSIQSVFDSPLLGFYSPIVRAWEFGVGALIALWLFQRQKKFGRRVSALLFVAGIALLTAAISPLVLLGEFPGPITALPVVGTALTILGGSGQPFAGRQLLSGRPLVLIGDWSYSIYL